MKLLTCNGYGNAFLDSLSTGKCKGYRASGSNIGEGKGPDGARAYKDSLNKIQTGVFVSRTSETEQSY